MKHIIEQINIKDKQTSKNGNDYYPCGVKIQGVWYNANIWPNQVDDIKQLKEGSELECELYKDEYQGKEYDKFRLPKKANALGKKLDEILAGQQEMKEALKIINNKISKLSDPPKLPY